MIKWIEYNNEKFEEQFGWEFVCKLPKRGMLFKMKDGEILLIGDINLSCGTNDEFCIDKDDIIAFSTDLIDEIELKIKNENHSN